LDEGVNKLGAKLQRYASNSYAARKYAINPFPGFGNPDLFRTGAFQRGFKLKILTKNSFDIYSTDSKANDLTRKYGADVFGLTNESRDQYRAETMQPELVKAVKKVLHL
jgi:hypothetical protein